MKLRWKVFIWRGTNPKYNSNPRGMLATVFQKRCTGCPVYPCSEHEYPDADCEEQRACESWFDDEEQ